MEASATASELKTRGIVVKILRPRVNERSPIFEAHSRAVPRRIRSDVGCLGYRDKKPAVAGLIWAYRIRLLFDGKPVRIIVVLITLALGFGFGFGLRFLPVGIAAIA